MGQRVRDATVDVIRDHPFRIKAKDRLTHKHLENGHMADAGQWNTLIQSSDQQWTGSEWGWRICSGSSHTNGNQSYSGMTEVDSSDVLCLFLTVVVQWWCPHLTGHLRCCGFDWRQFYPFPESTDCENSLVSFPWIPFLLMLTKVVSVFLTNDPDNSVK